MFIDSHAHLTAGKVYDDIDGILLRAKNAGVGNVVNVCTDEVTLQRGLTLAQEHPEVVNIAATTPHDVEKEGSNVFPLMSHHAHSGDLRAVGETGLDYHYRYSSPDIQKEFFIRYLHLALKCRLPVIVHCRDAFPDLIAILDAEYCSHANAMPGVLHCFTGTVSDADAVLHRGWFISMSGIMTFKNSHELRDVVKITPIDRLMIETDTPYLAPQSKRGKVNEPSYLPEIAEVMATVKNMKSKEVEEITCSNAQKMFGIKP